MGIPNVDYFISSELTEPTNAEGNYTEKLVKLKTLGYYLHKIEIPQKHFTLEQFGIPKNKSVYACLQSLFKLHPDFDVFIAKLFERDPDALLLMLDGQNKEWNQIVIRRIERLYAEADKKIIFLPRQPRDKFLAYFLLPDAVLDTIYFSGGHTSLECFALGVPVVTLPSSQMAGRLTYGYYKRMGIMDCVANDSDEYVDIAFRLAHDRTWKENISIKIKEKSDIFFNNLEDVKEMEQFFEWAVKSAYHQSQ